MQYLASRSYTAQCQPALPVSLQEEKSDNQRNNRHQRSGQNQGKEQLGATVCARLGVPRCQTQGEWVIGGIAQDQQRQEVVVPCCHKREQQDRHKTRNKNPERYTPEDAHFTSSISTSTIQKLHGNRLFSTHPPIEYTQLSS